MLVVKAPLVDGPVQSVGNPPTVLPADAKRVDTASERISVCRGTECRIQIPVDEEADRRAVSYNRDVRPSVQRNLGSSANQIVGRLTPYIPACGLPSESEMIARIQAEQILIISAFTPLVD